VRRSPPARQVGSCQSDIAFWGYGGTGQSTNGRPRSDGLRALANLYTRDPVVVAGARHQVGCLNCTASGISLDEPGSGHAGDCADILRSLRPHEKDSRRVSHAQRVADSLKDGSSTASSASRIAAKCRREPPPMSHRGWCVAGPEVGQLIEAVLFFSADRLPTAPQRASPVKTVSVQDPVGRTFGTARSRGAIYSDRRAVDKASPAAADPPPPPPPTPASHAPRARDQPELSATADARPGSASRGIPEPRSSTRNRRHQIRSAAGRRIRSLPSPVEGEVSRYNPRTEGGAAQ